MKRKTKFKVGDNIRRIVRRPGDRNMEVKRVERDYYLCNNIGTFSSTMIPFDEERNYELIKTE